MQRSFYTCGQTYCTASSGRVGLVEGPGGPSQQEVNLCWSGVVGNKWQKKRREQGKLRQQGTPSLGQEGQGGVRKILVVVVFVLR
jgi:hypothetical protein